MEPGLPHRDRDAIVCDGAVRSGKTLCLGLSFFLWSMSRFRGQQFALCGKTTESVRRNLLASVLPVLGGLGFQWEEQRGRNRLTVRYGRAGEHLLPLWGMDEGSAALIQGITLAGVLLDEVAPDAPVLRGAGLRPVLGDGGQVLVLLQPGGAGALVLPGMDLQGGGTEPSPPAVSDGGQPHPLPGDPAAV